MGCGIYTTARAGAQETAALGKTRGHLGELRRRWSHSSGLAVENRKSSQKILLRPDGNPSNPPFWNDTKEQPILSFLFNLLGGNIYKLKI